jgi:hypothetical protein
VGGDGGRRGHRGEPATRLRAVEPWRGKRMGGGLEARWSGQEWGFPDLGLMPVCCYENNSICFVKKI